MLGAELLSLEEEFKLPEDDEMKNDGPEDDRGGALPDESLYEFLPAERRAKPRDSAPRKADSSRARPSQIDNQVKADFAEFGDNPPLPSSRLEVPAAKLEDQLVQPKESPQKHLKPEDLNAYEDKLSPEVVASRKLDETTYSPDFTAPRPAHADGQPTIPTDALDLSPNQMDVIATLNTQAQPAVSATAPMTLATAQAMESEQQMVNAFIATKASG